MEIQAGVAAQVSQTRSELATNAVKQSAEQDKRIADIIETAASNVPSNSTRGTNVNISV